MTFQMHEHVAQNLAGSRLKIINLDVSDIGFYTCRVTNGKDQIQSEGTLRVDSSKKWPGKSFQIKFYQYLILYYSTYNS